MIIFLSTDHFTSVGQQTCCYGGHEASTKKSLVIIIIIIIITEHSSPRKRLFSSSSAATFSYSSSSYCHARPFDARYSALTAAAGSDYDTLHHHSTLKSTVVDKKRVLTQSRAMRTKQRAWKRFLMTKKKIQHDPRGRLTKCEICRRPRQDYWRA